MLEQVRVLIIIVTWNKKQYVLDLLASLQQLSYPTRLMDIVVVDNASDDGTQQAIAQQYPTVHLICNEENLGGTGGFNTGLAFAFEQEPDKYDYLWLLDNDVQVNQNALLALVEVLQQEKDIAIAGSTMMQMDYPWRINEMGAFVDLGNCSLQLNRFREKVAAFQSQTLPQLLSADIDLSQQLMHCQPVIDVDYVAAASLLIRFDVAQRAGLWDDYFIHFDDVEWCLRIAKMGYRVVVSARSLIWHMSADTKVPDWVLYYDNRNALNLLAKHSGQAEVANTRRYILKKALYYTLLGKTDLARLHLDAIDDYEQQQMGKKQIKLDSVYLPTEKIADIFSDKEIKRVLIPWTVNLQAANIQTSIVKIMKQRADLHIDYLLPPPGIQCKFRKQLPLSGILVTPGFFISRYWFYFRLAFKNYDLVLQSDYQAILMLSWVSRKILYVNNAAMSLRKRINLRQLRQMVGQILSRYFLPK